MLDWVFLGLLGLCVFWWRYRPVLAELLLAEAGANLLLRLASGEGWPTWEGVPGGEAFQVEVVMLLAAVLVLRVARRGGRDLSLVPPTCEKCGYNLTGNVTGRCPECGRAVPRGLLAGKVEQSRAGSPE